MCADFDATQQLVQALLGHPCSNAEQAAVAEAAMAQADPDGACAWGGGMGIVDWAWARQAAMRMGYVGQHRCWPRKK